jgi:membrane-bound lytic murein transglycosylase F
VKFIFRYFEILLIFGLVGVASILYFVDEQSQSLEEMQRSGMIRVLISDEPDSQYVFNRRHYGFEYELLQRFAKDHNLRLKLKIVPFAELFTMLESGAGDIAVGGIIQNPYVERVSQPTIPWYQAQTAIVYKRGSKRPLNLKQLEGVPVLASARYYQLEGFEALNLQDDFRSEYSLLNAVAKGRERFAISTNYRAKNAKHYLPELNRSFILPNDVELVWALPNRHDPLFLAAVNTFLQSAIDQNLPNMLAENYLALPKRLSTYDALSLHRKIENTLPKFEFAFRKAARRAGIDWTLLAAMAYQESRWSNAARSPTGVRGIMQMTQRTAESLGVTDRLDMNQSIDAAAEYLLKLRNRLPARIKEPERTWFAVGAYNMGFKHIMNAYVAARKKGLNRTQWSVVSETLPNLYGTSFSKGVQAQDYVERIQIFTDILRFYDLHQREDILLKPVTEVVNPSIAMDDG